MGSKSESCCFSGQQKGVKKIEDLRDIDYSKNSL